jgi:predicted PurR-regulated permease PerM
LKPSGASAVGLRIELVDSTARAANDRTPSPAPGTLPAPDARARRISRLVFAGAMALLALWVARPYVTALAWAVVIAIAVWPLYVRFADRWPGKRRFVAPLIVTLATALALAIPILVGVVEIGGEAQTIVAWLTEAQQKGVPVPDWLVRLPIVGQYLDRWWASHLSDPKAAGDLLNAVGGDALRTLPASFGWQLLRNLFLALLTLMTLFLLLRDGDRLGARLLDVADRWLGGPGERLAEKMVTAVRGTVNGTVLVAVGEGALIGIGYVWAGVPHAVLFSLLTVAVAMLPLGAWLAFTAAALVLLLQGGSAVAAGLVWGWGAAVMLIGDNFVQPALIGGAARLPFLWALIGIFGGIEAFGLIGLFLGPVIMAALITIWREWVDADTPAGTTG